LLDIEVWQHVMNGNECHHDDEWALRAMHTMDVCGMEQESDVSLNAPPLHI